jgi:hypothetical protein
MQQQIKQIMLMVQQNPKLAQVRSINRKEYNEMLCCSSLLPS